MKYNRLFSVFFCCALMLVNFVAGVSVSAEYLQDDITQIEADLLNSNPFFDYDLDSKTIKNLPFSTTVDNFETYFATEIEYAFYDSDSNQLTGTVTVGDYLIIYTDLGEIVAKIDSITQPRMSTFSYQGTNYSLPLNVAGLVSTKYVSTGFDEPSEKEFPSYSGHKGIDFYYVGISGANVYSVERGVVERVNSNCNPTVPNGSCGSGWGNYVKISHPDGTSTMYAHLSTVKVSLSTNVVKSAIIGTVGNSGDSSNFHLHFEVYIGSNRVNPKEYLRNAPLPNRSSAAYMMPYSLSGKAAFVLFSSNGNNGFNEGVGSSSTTYSLARDTNNQAVGRYGDVNGDGYADYVMPYTDGGLLKLVSFLGQSSGKLGNGVLTQSTSFGLITDSYGQGTGQLIDANGDGFDDYVMPYQTDAGKIKFVTFISNKNGTFKEGITSTSTSYGMIRDSKNQGVGFFADVTGDGRYDYVMPYLENGKILLVTFVADSSGRYSNGTLTKSTQFGMIKDNIGQGTGRMADINGDGKMDYVMPYQTDAGKIKFVIFISKGNGSFNEGYTSSSTDYGMIFDSNKQGVGIFGDITGDGRDDYVMPYQSNGKIYLISFISNSNGVLSNGTLTKSTQFGMIKDDIGQGTGRLIDVNNDGKLDYVMPYLSDSGIIKFVTFISNGNGTFKEGVVTASAKYGMVLDNLKRGTGQFVEN